MGKVDVKDGGSLLGDFANEAGTHIERIESAFLDLDALAGSPALLDAVFRAAHSLKGTAGFFSLDKIVAAAHALESVFTRLKSGDLPLCAEVADVVLESVDCLKALVKNLDAPDSVDTEALLSRLMRYAGVKKPDTTEIVERMPFDLRSPATEKILADAALRGHKAYYLKVHFDRGLGRYYGHPEGLLDDILSIGSIVEAVIDGEEIGGPPSGAVEKLADALAGRCVLDLELLVTSILEPALFLIAVELEDRCVHLISREAVRDGEGAEKAAPQAPAPAAGVPMREEGLSFQVDVAVINALTGLANEMVLTRNRLLSFLSGYRRSIVGLSPMLHDMDRLAGEIQERIMRARMQPVGLLFKRFPRMIRDTAKSLGKDIQTAISGGDVALDKYLLDALTDPITQLIKNAVDHGIESGPRRAALGKPPAGAIALRARARDGAAVIEIEDDGAGMNPDVLRRKGLERGLASEEELAAMTGPALFALIFEPGFSTARQVTNLSGRGVGMDIVKTNIEKLGGSVEVESEPDRGTTIRLRVPLVLSALRTLVVTVDAVEYAVPEADVERIVRVSGAPESPMRFELLDSWLVLNLDGWVLPAVTLEEVDARARGTEPPASEEILRRIRQRRIAKCLLLRAGGGYFALLIDEAVKTEETLINPPPAYLRSCRCYLGATVLGSGKAVMILDAEGIMRLIKIAGAGRKPAEEEDGPRADVRSVVVLQCSGAEYFALAREEIARVERIATGAILEKGGARFADVAGKSVRVLRPEDYAPVQTRAYSRENLCLLMLGAGASPTGFLAGRVLDQIEASFPAGGPPESPYVSGWSAYREKPLIFLNAAEIALSLEKGVNPLDPSF